MNPSVAKTSSKRRCYTLAFGHADPLGVVLPRDRLRRR